MTSLCYSVPRCIFMSWLFPVRWTRLARENGQLIYCSFDRCQTHHCFCYSLQFCSYGLPRNSRGRQSPRCRADVRTPRSGAGVTQAAARSSARCTRPARKALPSKKKTESCLDAEKARGANKSTSASQSPLNVPGGHQQQARLPDDRRPPGASRRTQTNKTNGCRSRQPRSAPAVDKKEDIDITQAMKRLSQLKSLLTKASDPPQIAAEMATLHLVLSDHRGALKSFRLAVEPSPGKQLEQ